MLERWALFRRRSGGVEEVYTGIIGVLEGRKNECLGSILTSFFVEKKMLGWGYWGACEDDEEVRIVFGVCR